MATTRPIRNDLTGTSPTQPARRRRPSYPSKTNIMRAVTAMRESGVNVGSVEINPDGSIRVFDVGAVPKPQDEFERWEDRL